MADAADLQHRLEETQAEILAAMRELVEHAGDTAWLNDTETVFERLAYLYEMVGGDRVDLVREFPECFDIEMH